MFHTLMYSPIRSACLLVPHPDCTIVAKFLLSLEGHAASCAVVDHSGHPALVSMIKRMPKMVSA